MLVIALVCFVAAVVIYTAAPQQRLLTTNTPRWWSIAAGLVLLSVAQILLNQRFGPAVSVFVMLTQLMLAWTLLPLLTAYLRHRCTRPDCTKPENSDEPI